MCATTVIKRGLNVAAAPGSTGHGTHGSKPGSKRGRIGKNNNNRNSSNGKQQPKQQQQQQQQRLTTWHWVGGWALAMLAWRRMFMYTLVGTHVCVRVLSAL